MMRTHMPLYITATVSGIARGAYLVCIGWNALVLSDDVAVVGWVFIVHHLTIMLTGPLVGTIIDRYRRRYLAALGHTVIPLAMISLAAPYAVNLEPTLLHMFVVVIIVNVSRLLFFGSFDSLTRGVVAPEKIPKVLAVRSSCHLFATALGTVFIGFAMHESPLNVGYVLVALFSVPILVSVLFIPEKPRTTERNPGLSGYIEDLKAGFVIVRHDQRLLIITLVAAVALPLGQLSNALLSSFIRDDYGGGSDIFGSVDAAWAVGGMTGTFILGFVLSRYRLVGWEYYFAALAGLATALFSFMAHPMTLMFFHALMGGMVWCARILIDGRILQICSNETVGRTKINIEVMVSLSAVIMCFSPTLIKFDATGSYFLLWGMLVMISAMMLCLKSKLPRESGSI